jgi:succinate dehydrogenase/fumarate reductase flavoprotein subunit
MNEIHYFQVKEWPYPVNYGKENEVVADVLIIGGGIAGCHAAINAAKRSARVVVVEKAATIRSGCGGAGVDHWGSAFSNPCSKITPEEGVEGERMFAGLQMHYMPKHCQYITAKEGYDALLDVEEMGVQFRDVDDEFAGAPFRDEETKIMFAYDYDNKTTIRVRGGANIKPALYNELKRLGVEIYDRVMATSLLTEGGKPGSRVIGAIGVNVRTGEFYIFKAKATVLSTAQPLRIWVFSTELAGSYSAHDDPNLAGDGCAMAWKAGAELALMEQTTPTSSAGGFRWPAYGVGHPGDTWYPCTIVDANGKEIPWVDKDGNILKRVEERSRSGSTSLITDLPERIKKGEFALPFYADLPSMPPHERRAIWGLMVGNEGKTREGIYELYNKAGFDPDKDMLQANIMPPDGYSTVDWFQGWGMGPPQWLETAFGGRAGVVVDWDLKTNLEGLYAAGNQIAGFAGHPGASATGRYAGRKAAAYAKTASEPVIDRKQVEEEKARVYAPIKRNEGMGWKELQAGLCRIMQDYCGPYRNEETLKMGLRWLDSIKENEASIAYARNPHELMRILECLVRITVGETMMHASLARKASSRELGFNRLDYPEIDPPEWNKFVTIRLENGEVKVGDLPLNYYLLPPNDPTYEENYKKHCGL